MIDVEADGQCPGYANMTWFGAVYINDLSHTFDSGLLLPTVPDHVPNWREYPTGSRFDYPFGEPRVAMTRFADWIKALPSKDNRVMMWSDNNGWDYQWINWYFHFCSMDNPFGHTSTNLGSFYKGVIRTMFKNFKHLRETEHDHNPVHDAMGNVEALLKIARKYEIQGLPKTRQPTKKEKADG
jgi:hypothetical protein